MGKINHGERVYLAGMIVAIIAALAIGFIGGTYYYGDEVAETFYLYCVGA